MAKTVSWNPNRYGSTKKVLQFNSSTGAYSVVDQDHDYTGINYNFSSLPSGNTQTTSTQTTNTQTTDTQTTDTQQQTAEAFGDVRPWWWRNESSEGGGGGGSLDQSNMFKTQENTNVSGFFKPLGEAIEGNKPNLGTRLRHQFADITGKTDREWGQVDKDIRIDQIQTDLSSGKLGSEEEQALRTELSDLERPSLLGPFSCSYQLFPSSETKQAYSSGAKLGRKIATSRMVMTSLMIGRSGSFSGIILFLVRVIPCLSRLLKQRTK